MSPRRSPRPNLPDPVLAKRVIPCLDVHAGRVVKGVNFVALRDAGDPVEDARRYDEAGADEIEREGRAHGRASRDGQAGEAGLESAPPRRYAASPDRDRIAGEPDDASGRRRRMITWAQRAAAEQGATWFKAS